MKRLGFIILLFCTGTIFPQKISLMYKMTALDRFAYRVKMTGNEQEHNFDFNIPVHQAYIGLIYKYNFAHEKSPFSSIDCELGYSYGFINKIFIFSYESSLLPRDGHENEYVIINMPPDQNHFDARNVSTLSLRLKTPFLFLGQNLCFSFGEEVSYRRLTAVAQQYSTFSMVREVVLDNGDHWMKPVGAGVSWLDEQERNYNFINADPFINIACTLPSDFGISCELAYNYYSFGIGYNL